MVPGLVARRYIFGRSWISPDVDAVRLAREAPIDLAANGLMAKRGYRRSAARTPRRIVAPALHQGVHTDRHQASERPHRRLARGSESKSASPASVPADDRHRPRRTPKATVSHLPRARQDFCSIPNEASPQCPRSQTFRVVAPLEASPTDLVRQPGQQLRCSLPPNMTPSAAPFGTCRSSPPASSAVTVGPAVPSPRTDRPTVLPRPVLEEMARFRLVLHGVGSSKIMVSVSALWLEQSAPTAGIAAEPV